MSCMVAKKGHICYLGNAASIHLIRWANYFAEREWDVDIITWRLPADMTKLNSSIKIHRVYFPPHSILRYGTLLEIIALMRKIRPTIIHGHYLSNFGALAAMYGRIFKFKPVILTVWGNDLLFDIKTIQKHLIKFTILNADQITTDGEFIKDMLIKLGVNSEKVKIILFGTDTKKFSPVHRSEKLRKELGLENSFGVISLRNFEYFYDIESLIKAVPLVLKEIPDVKFLIFGSGPLENDLKQLTNKLGVSNNVFFPGKISNDALPEYLASVDLYISTSLSDAGLSASTAEAMASGLPAIITDFGVNAQWVLDGHTGYIVPLKNPEKLAELIVKSLNNKELLKIFGERNRRIIEERNNYYVEMQKMEDQYRALQNKEVIL